MDKIRDGTETPDAVTVAQLDAFDEVIDVRSPAEFALDTCPTP